MAHVNYMNHDKRKRSVGGDEPFPERSRKTSKTHHPNNPPLDTKNGDAPSNPHEASRRPPVPRTPSSISVLSKQGSRAASPVGDDQTTAQDKGKPLPLITQIPTDPRRRGRQSAVASPVVSEASVEKSGALTTSPINGASRAPIASMTTLKTTLSSLNGTVATDGTNQATTTTNPVAQLIAVLSTSEPSVFTSRLQSRLDAAREELERLRKHTYPSVIRIQQKENEVRKQEHELLQHNNNLMGAKKAQEQLLASLLANFSNNTNLEQRYKEMESKYDALRKQFDDQHQVGERLKASEAKINELTKRDETLEREFYRRIDDLDSLRRSDNNNLSTKVKNLREDIDRTLGLQSDRLATLEGDLSRYRKDCTTGHEKSETNAKALDVMHQVLRMTQEPSGVVESETVKDLDGRLSQVQKECATLRQKAAALTVQHEANSNGQKSLKERQDDLMNRANAASEINANQALLENRLNALEQEVKIQKNSTTLGGSAESTRTVEMRLIDLDTRLKVVAKRDEVKLLQDEYERLSGIITEAQPTIAQAASVSTSIEALRQDIKTVKDKTENIVRVALGTPTTGVASPPPSTSLLTLKQDHSTLAEKVNRMEETVVNKLKEGSRSASPSTNPASTDNLRLQLLERTVDLLNENRSLYPKRGDIEKDLASYVRHDQIKLIVRNAIQEGGNGSHKTSDITSMNVTNVEDKDHIFEELDDLKGVVDGIGAKVDILLDWRKEVATELDAAAIRDTNLRDEIGRTVDLRLAPLVDQTQKRSEELATKGYLNASLETFHEKVTAELKQLLASFNERIEKQVQRYAPKDEVEGVSASIKALREGSVKVENEVKELAQKVEGTRTSLASPPQPQVSLELVGRVDMLERNLATNDRTFDTLNSRLTDVQTNAAQQQQRFQTKFDSINQNLHVLSVARNSLELRFNNLTTDSLVNKMVHHLRVLYPQHPANVINDITITRDRLAALENFIKGFRRDYDALKKKINSTSQSPAPASEELTLLKKRVDELTIVRQQESGTPLADATETVENLTKFADLLAADLGELKERFESVESSLSQKLGDLTGRLEPLEALAESSKGLFLTPEERQNFGNLAAGVQEAKTQLGNLDTLVQELKAQLGRIESDGKTSNQQLQSEIEAQLEQVNTDFAWLSEKNGELLGNCNALREKFDDLEKAVNESKKNSDDNSTLFVPPRKTQRLDEGGLGGRIKNHSTK